MFMWLTARRVYLFYKVKRLCDSKDDLSPASEAGKMLQSSVYVGKSVPLGEV